MSWSYTGRDHRVSHGGGERGEGAPSFIAVVLVVALIAGGIVAVGVPGDVVGYLKRAVCQVTSGQECAGHGSGGSAGEPGGRNGEPPGGGTEPSPGDGTGQREPDAEKPEDDKDEPDDGYWDCHWTIRPGCDITEGLAEGTGKMLSDMWGGITFTGCLLHVCSQSGFENDWGNIKELFTSNPWDTAKVIWGDQAGPVIDDFKNDRGGVGIARTVPTLIGLVFGGKGISKLRKLKKNKKNDPNEEKEAPGPSPAELRRLTEATGEPTSVTLLRRGHELPYTSPPGTRVVRPGTPLDLSSLQPGTRYLWLVDPQGNFRIAPEESPGYAGLYPKRPHHMLKHGDLAAGAPGSEVPQSGIPNAATRPLARAGGEIWMDGSGRLMMNNDSSYTFARDDGTRSGAGELQSVVNLLKAGGTDTSKIQLEVK